MPAITSPKPKRGLVVGTCWPIAGMIPAAATHALSCCAMVDRAMEQRHLALAHRHIAEGENRFARQAKLIERLRAGGHDTTEAYKLLANMADFLDITRVHRQLILFRLTEG